MGLLGDFFGSLFGVGYVGVKLLQESAEKARGKEIAEVYKSFIGKYTDIELENKLAKQIEDPSQYEMIWERIEEYKRSHSSDDVWFPLEFIDYGLDGWSNIGNRRISLDEFYKTLNRDNLKYVHTIKWFMFTYERLPKRFAETVLAKSFNSDNVLEYLRKNRNKYGI